MQTTAIALGQALASLVLLPATQDMEYD